MTAPPSPDTPPPNRGLKDLFGGWKGWVTVGIMLAVVSAVSTVLALVIAYRQLGYAQRIGEIEQVRDERDSARAVGAELKDRIDESERDVLTLTQEKSALQSRVAELEAELAAPDQRSRDSVALPIIFDMTTPDPQAWWDLGRFEPGILGDRPELGPPTVDFYVTQRDLGAVLVPYRDTNASAAAVTAEDTADIDVCTNAGYSPNEIPLQPGDFVCVRAPGDVEALLRLETADIAQLPVVPGQATVLTFTATTRPID